MSRMVIGGALLALLLYLAVPRLTTAYAENAHLKQTLAAKDAELARAAATFRSKHPTKAFPCPSGAQHVLKRSARDLLMRQSTRRRRVATT